MAGRNISNHFKSKKTDHASKTTDGKSEVDIIDEEQSTSAHTKDVEYLRQFDLNSQFGPCTGITRLERWERAEKFGLKPPVGVRDLIRSHSQDTEFIHSLWHRYEV